MTVATCFYLNEDMEWIGTDGRPGKVHSRPDWMLILGWVFYAVSVILNGIFYKLHPSGPDLTVSALKMKLLTGKEEMLPKIIEKSEDIELIPFINS